MPRPATTARPGPHAGLAIKSALLLPTVMASVEDIPACRDRLQHSLDDLDRQGLVSPTPS